MGDQHEAAWSDVPLRRPAFDPRIPAADRALLAARGSLLPAASQDRPARRRSYLPTDPRQRLATIDGTVTGMTAAGLTALFGTTPLAVGVLVFQGPAGWETASNHYALVLAGVIAVITTLLAGSGARLKRPLPGKDHPRPPSSTRRHPSRTQRGWADKPAVSPG